MYYINRNNWTLQLYIFTKRDLAFVKLLYNIQRLTQKLIEKLFFPQVLIVFILIVLTNAYCENITTLCFFNNDLHCRYKIIINDEFYNDEY